MAHYECNKCGRVASSTGGFCDACTPKHVLDAATALEIAADQARDRFQRSVRAQMNAYVRKAVSKQKAALAAEVRRWKKGKK